MSTSAFSFRRVVYAPVPFYLVLLIVVVFTALFVYSKSKQSSTAQNNAPVIQTADCITSLNILRLKDYELTKPILLADIPRESSELEETKAAILDVIHQQKEGGNAKTVSVYLRKFNDGSWITINQQEQYDPGSILKVSLLIAILKQAQSNPSLLDKKILFSIHGTDIPKEYFLDDTLMPGTKYSIRELLRRMIVYSDNDAVTLLNQDLNVTMLQKLFTDLGLTAPQPQTKYLMTAEDCAKFMRVLFNSSYLKPEFSENALRLLTESRFHKGLTDPLPATLKVAHKFGEAGTFTEPQLHEEGIVYIDNNPYLLVIMTKGSDYDRLSQCVSAISKVVYGKFAVAS